MSKVVRLTDFEVTNGADLSMFRSLVVWCEQFGVLLASAPLTEWETAA